MKSTASLRVRLLVAFCTVSFLTLACIAGYDLYRMNKEVDQNVSVLRQNLMDQFDRGLKLQVQTAVSIVENIHKQQGTAPIAEVQKKAAELIRELRYDNGNYFWIDTFEGINVALLSRQDVEGKSRWESKDTKGKLLIQEIIQSGQKKEGGFTDYWFPKPNQTDALPKKAYSLAYEPFRWVIGTGNWYDDIEKIVAVKEQEYRTAFQTAVITQISITITALLLAFLSSLWLGGSLAKPIIAVARQLDRFAGGDLRQPTEKSIISRGDEIGVMGCSLEEMRRQLAELIKGLSSAAHLLASSSHELNASAEQSAQASEQVAVTITGVAEGAQKQSNAVHATMQTVNEMASAIQHIARNAGNVAQESTDTSKAAAEGATAVVQAAKQMEAINHSVAETAGVVRTLGERSKEIGEIVSVITGIAGQTNLLALNAAIEAARAGEAGRGFAVVAEEVRKLAEQSEQAAGQITGIIAEIQRQTANAVSSMDAGAAEVVKGTTVVSETGERFHNIHSLVEGLNRRIQEISAASQELAASSEIVSRSVDEIRKITDQTADGTGTISAAAEEQSASMGEISTMSRSLSKMAEDLENNVRQFQV